MSDYPNLFTPVTIRGKTFRNRILAAPVTVRGLADGCTFSETAIAEYSDRARGGFAAVTVTETYVDFEYAGRGLNPIDLVTERAMENSNMGRVRRLTSGIQSHGALASIQFNHMGEINHPDTLGGKNPIGPTGYVRADGVTVEQMDIAMMEHVADNYAHACKNALSFGFDMVMLHGGHGWLLAQFLSPLTNRRTDEFGGSLENRAKFPIMVLDRIRDAVGDRLLLEYRISGDERVPGGLKLDEAAQFCRMIQDRVDLIHVTSGLYHSHVESKSFSSMFEPHGCNLDLAAAIKKAVDIPVVAVGGFNHPQQMEDAIAHGLCDFVAVGRQLIADPYLPLKAMSGRADDIAGCLRCSCFNPMPSDPAERANMGKMAKSCAVNPKAYRLTELQNAPKPEKSFNVLVVGAGPAGLYAASTAAERGHRVVLADKAERPGGALWFADYDCHKADLKNYRDVLIRRAERAGAEMRMNTEVTADFIRELHPDCVICAIGAEPVIPDIPGVGLAAHATEIYSHPEKTGRRVVIIGGGQLGCETALHLADTGEHEITLISRSEAIAKDAYYSQRVALKRKMAGKVEVMTSAACTEISPDGVSWRKNGETFFTPADSVYYAVGMKPRTAEADGMRGGAAWFVPVGDCVKAGCVEDAVYSGFNAAMDII